MSGSPRPTSGPWYWPAAPPVHGAYDDLGASFYDGEGGVGGPPPPGWVVSDVPPAPFPYVDPQNIDYAKFGPPGTIWQWDEVDLSTREMGSALSLLAQERILAYISDVLGGIQPPIGTPRVWTVPQPEVPMTAVSLYRATIHATYGTTEEAANVLHYRQASGWSWDPDTGVADALALGAALRDQWQAFLGSIAVAPSQTVASALLGIGAHYDEVRVAIVEYTGYAKGATPSKPVYQTDTQYVPFTEGLRQGGGNPVLPNEVALCLSLGTGVRGPAHRGRTYLGPLAQSAMGDNGIFDTTMIRKVAAAWADCMVTGMAANDPSYELVVASHRLGTASGVNEVRVGEVPDSQRRRRRSQPEQYFTAFPHV